MWRTLPIFVSSTFEDFQAERDHLRTVVFPALEEKLRTLRRHLEWVDLRIGVGLDEGITPEERERKILKVCLDEARRCRPFFLVLVGDRYGYVPPPEQVSAAAREAGLQLADAACSVTELELELGVFAAQQTRALFYFREPLPYWRMGAARRRFTSASSAAAARLARLKQRIERNHGARVRRYGVKWDAARAQVRALEAWGERVIEDIWRECVAEAGGAQAPLLSPDDEERLALEEFIEQRGRDFIGRQTLLASLEESLIGEGPDAMTCVSGAPGAGKSALFAALARRLSAADALVMAHAAGASPRAASIDAMLHRWIGELSSALGREAPALDGVADAQVEASFAALLEEAARRRRVVLLIDAADQFEPGARAQNFAWAPQAWPQNVRVLVTGVPGPALTAASARAHTVPLTPFESKDAERLIRAISARYHRAIEPAVIDAMLSRAGAHGPAHANALWVVLAAEDMNLIDADDLSRAKKDFSGSSAERLLAMMVDRANALPADPQGLYQSSFVEAEQEFGAAAANAFIGLIALGRAGWRESDFRALMPELGAGPWSELRFAALRRMFRGQIRQRGIGQWDFAHAQMRIAALKRLDARAASALHQAIAGHLLAAPRQDPLRATETLHHLIRAQDWAGAARYCADLSHDAPAIAGIDQSLVEALQEPSWPALPAVTHMLDVADTHDRYFAAQRLQYGAADQLTHREALPLLHRLALHAKLRDVFAGLRDKVGDDIRWHNHMAGASARIAADHIALGEFAAAAPLLNAVVAANQELVRADPSFAEWRRELSVAHNKLGQLQLDMGEADSAIETIVRGIEAIQAAIALEPQNAAWRRDLEVSHRLHARALARAGRGGEAVTVSAADSPAAELDLAHAYDDQFDSLLISGRTSEAERVARQAIDIRERALRLDPGDLYTRRALAQSWRRLAGALTGQAAIDAMERAAAQAEDLAARDPNDAARAEDAAGALIQLAIRLVAARELPRAEEMVSKGEARLALLLQKNPGRQLLLIHKSEALRCRAQIAAVRGSAGEAERLQRAGLAAIREAHAQSPRPEVAIGKALMELGDLILSQGDLGRADECFAEAHDVFAQCARAGPGDINAAQAAVSMLGKRGMIRGREGDDSGAFDLLERARAQLEALARDFPDAPAIRYNLAGVTINVAHALAMLGRENEALDRKREAIALLTPFAAADPAAAAMLAQWRAS